MTVHHATYSRFEKEADGDLEALCWKHHMLVHAVEIAKCVGCGGRAYASNDEAEAVLDRYLDDCGLAASIRDGLADWFNLPTKEYLASVLSAGRGLCLVCQCAGPV